MNLNSKSPDALLDLRGLLSLAAVADSGSVAAAAATLGWSHPTVDHHLRRLEKSLGAALLERHPRGSRLTELGELVAAQAQRTLALNDETRQLVESWLLHRTHRVRLGVFPSAAAVIASVHDAFADSSVELLVSVDETVELATQLTAGKLDLAVLFTAGPGGAAALPERISQRTLRSERMLLAVPVNHPLSGSDGRARLSDFADDRWALGASDHDPVDRAFIHRCIAAGFEPRAGMRSDDYSVILELVAAGVFVAAVPESVVTTPPPGVRVLSVSDAPLHRDTILAIRRADPLVSTVADAVVHAAAEAFGE